MNKLGYRVSCNRTTAVGRRNPDWSNQSVGRVDKDGKAVAPRRKSMFNQVLMDQLVGPVSGVTINKVEKIRDHNDKGVATKERYIGMYKGRRVERNGYAYSFVANGKTPGRWYYC